MMILDNIVCILFDIFVIYITYNYYVIIIGNRKCKRLGNDTIVTRSRESNTEPRIIQGKNKQSRYDIMEFLIVFLCRTFNWF